MTIPIIILFAIICIAVIILVVFGIRVLMKSESIESDDIKQTEGIDDNEPTDEEVDEFLRNNV